MQWLNQIVDEVISSYPEGEILIESGASPSGTYHVGHLREIVISDAIMLELTRRGRQARHVQFVDDLDAMRKIPINVPAEYEKYLGQSLCDVPAPDGSKQSYADFFLNDLTMAALKLGIEMEIMRSHEKYRAGLFAGTIETVLTHIDAVRNALKTVSGRQLDDNWSPIQVNEGGYLKNRKFIRIDTTNKTIVCLDKAGKEQTIRYDNGDVKLDWRVDWPARWSLLNVHVEAFGREHATKGGSYDTGEALAGEVFNALPPMPVPYESIHRTGDTKKMSASKGTGVAAAEAVEVLPPEIVRYFILRYPPNKILFFDEVEGIMKLVDEFAELAAKTNKTPQEEQLLTLSTRGLGQKTVSRIPFSHLVASYQAALKDVDKTLEVIRRTEHASTVDEDESIIRKELEFIHEWLERWAPADVKFALAASVDTFLNDQQKQFLSQLADKIASAPADADGEWFHKAVYDFKESLGIEGKELFITLYKVIIGQDFGPRAGWFLSILPREWLIERLRLQK